MVVSMVLSVPTDGAVALPERTVVMDEGAFCALYERTARQLRAYLLRGCGDRTLADDLLQETYLRMLRSGFEGNDDRHRRNYLYRIATNLLTDHYRRTRPQTDQLPQHDGSPSHAHEIHLRSDIGSALAELAPRDRQMLWLAYVEGASHAEIADIMGLRTASVRSMLFRARHRLAEELKTRGLRPGTEAT